MKLIIDAPDEIIKKGFEGPLTDEERQILIRAIGNGTTYKVEGDLISRETLKKVIAEKATFIDGDSVYKIIDLIDNAPTVENITVFTESTDEKAIADLKEELQKIIAEKRPKGEWITTNLEKPYARCNLCGEICEMDNFCGNCGADMKGGAE